MLQKSEGDAGFRVKRLAFFTPEEKTMEVNDAQRAYMITSTATRLLLRSPPASSETFTQDVSGASWCLRRASLRPAVFEIHLNPLQVSGVTMTVLKTSVVFENKWMATRLSVAVACPTPEGEEVVGWRLSSRSIWEETSLTDVGYLLVIKGLTSKISPVIRCLLFVSR